MYRIALAVCFAVLSFTLVLPSFHTVQAQGPPEFSLPDGAGEIGQRIPLNLDFVNDGDVAGLNITINYDQSVVGFDPFSFFDVIAGPDLVGLPSISLSSVVTPGQIVIILNQGTVGPALPDGEILTINFVINDSAMVGESSPLDISINTLTDTNGDFILPPVADLTPGSMTVVSEPGEDVNVLINKSAGIGRIDAGVPVLVTYEINLNAVGDLGAQATDVFVTDPLPSEASFRADLSSEECEMILGPSNTVECDAATLIVGEERDFEIVVSIVGQAGTDILNQAIVDFIDDEGIPQENTSNTVTIAVRGGGGGGGGGCAVADSGHIGTSGIANLAVLLIPLAFVLFKARKRFIR